MASLAPSRTVPIALLYQAPSLHQHLKQALSDLGARVVYDTPAAEFDRGALDRSGAEVIVINLDPDVDEEFEQLGDLLADEALKVIFNDGEVSSRLEGWDQARWARHLAAKILGATDMNPPRPAGASAIPVKVRASAPEYPGAPEVEGSFELHGHELERALSADTGEAISLTRAALVTKDEPVAAQLVPRPDVRDAPTLELPVGELMRDIPQWQAEPVAPPAVAAAPAAPPVGVAAEFEAVLRDFGFLSTETAPVAAEPPAAAAAEAVDEFAGLGISLEPLPASAAADATSFDELSLDEAPPASAPFDELSLDEAAPVSAPIDELSLDEAAPVSAPIDELSLDADDAFDAMPAVDGGAALAEFDLGAIELEPFDESGSGTAFGQVQEAAAPQGLDDFLFELSLEEAEKAEKETKAPAPAPVRPEKQERVETAKRHDAAMRATPTVAGKALSGSRPADADEAKAAAPVARAATAEKAIEAPATPAAPRKFDFSGLSLEPTDEERFAAPTTGRATYRIDENERKPAEVAAAPPPPPRVGPSMPASVPVADDDEFSLGALDFSLDESTPITSESIVRGAPVESEEMPDVMAELEAVVGPPAPAETVAMDGPIKRVWVLGASIGGPEAVREFLGAIEPGVPALFLLAQHMGADFVELMTQQLARATKLNVRNVVAGERVAYGDVVVVPLGERLHIDAQGNVKTTPLDGMSPYSPSIDQVLMDVADRFGANAGAIVFSGMAHDAIDGSVYLAQKGGKVWAQDPATCVISSMVDGARDAGVVTFTGAPAELARQFQVEMYRAG